jgi:hypothetical protein
MKKVQKKNKEDYRYQDEFKDDLIHQFWHLVAEVKTLNEILLKIYEESTEAKKKD